MDDRLYDLMLKLPKKNIIHLMLGAMDSMQGYNGQSMNTCIIEAMGAEGRQDEETGKLSWKLPKVSVLRKRTEQQPL